MGNCSSGLETIPIPGIDGGLDETSKGLLLKALSSKEDTEEIMRTLIASNVDVNRKLEYEDIGSCYPLHIATKIGNYNAVDLLLKGGADHALIDSQGKTPLHWAISERNLDVTTRLIEAQADVNALSEDDITPLNLGIKANNEELVEKLLAAGADIFPEKGENPLVTAVNGNHVKTILPLLKANASPVGLSFDLPEGGPTSMQAWASEKGYDEIAEFLKEKFPEERAVSEMEKEIKEENEQREGGDGAEDISTPEELPPLSLEESPPDPSIEENSIKPSSDEDAGILLFEVNKTEPRATEAEAEAEEMPPFTLEHEQNARESPSPPLNENDKEREIFGEHEQRKQTSPQPQGGEDKSISDGGGVDH